MAAEVFTGVRRFFAFWRRPAVAGVNLPGPNLLTNLLRCVLVAGFAGISPAAAQPAVGAGFASEAAGPVADDAYRIGAGDELSVSYPYNPELNLAGPVGPDGRFVVPFVGNLAVAGRTLDEVAAEISQRLRSGGIVADARPVVAIKTYSSVIYVGGEVHNPGQVKLAQAGDPLQAVISAGGMLDTARLRKVVVIHRAADGSVGKRVVDLRAYAHDGHSPGLVLQAGDIVFVPRSSIAEADLWVDQYLNKLIPFSKSMNYSLGSAVVPVP